MIRHKDKLLYTLTEHPKFCPSCHEIGGYCGNCGGGYFDLKPSDFMLVTVSDCVYCNKHGENRNHVITRDAYLANRKAYDCGIHECTTGSTIFGGGPCCDIIGHSVYTLYE